MSDSPSAAHPSDRVPAFASPASTSPAFDFYGRLVAWLARPEVGRWLLLAVTLALSLRLIAVGGFRLNDASRHAMSGVFLLDLVREAGWRDPVAYAERYYARYPCLGIPHYYPPLFHAVEAVFFAVLGISAVTARLTVVAFHLAAVNWLYELVKRGWGAGVALVAGWLFATNPLVLFWSRQTMLEAPSVAMMLLASLALAGYLRQPNRWRALAWLAALTGALATKQTTAFLVPVHLSVLLLAGGRAPGRRRGLWLLVGAAVALAAGYAVYSWKYSPYQLRALTTSPVGSRLSIEHLAHYPRLLPVVVGVEILALCGLGLVRLARRANERRHGWLWLGWLVGFYGLQVLLTGRHPRYAYLWMPPFAVLAALGWQLLWQLPGPRRLVVPATLALLIPVTLRAALSRPPLISGYEQAAQFVAALDGGASVLVDAVWDGDFVFFSRQHDPRGRLILRGSKVLYTYASYRDVGFQTFAASDAEILEILKRYGVRYLVLEDVDLAHTEPGRRLRRLVRTPDFRPLARVPISTEGRLVRARYLEIYEFPSAPDPTAPDLELHFPGLGRKIRVPLKEFWGPAAGAGSDR